ncbi:MAG TPA: bacteriocin [Dongiaceae bacterium]|jgi:bacteriocin-like protein
MMNATAKPREIPQASNPTVQSKPTAELDEKELTKVSGGLCCTGKHISDGKITVRK